MSIINQLVITVQNTEKGSDEYENAFTDLFNIVTESAIRSRVSKFTRQLRGDSYEGYAEGAELLVELVEKWNGTGEFIALFKTSFNNRLINLVHKLNRQKRSHNTNYSESLSERVHEMSNHGIDDLTVEEATLHESLITEFPNIDDSTPSFEYLLSLYEEKRPLQAGIINLMLSFHDGTSRGDKLDAYCEYYGNDAKKPTIQKRVSRVRNDFKNFLMENGGEYYATI